MFIQTEATPNPATLKFLPGRPVLENGTLELRDAEQAAQSPLAERLFGVTGVSGVFLSLIHISCQPRQRARTLVALPQSPAGGPAARSALA